MRKKKKLTVIGLNSGTSMDGIDVAIFSIFFKNEEPPQGSATPPIGAAMIHSTLVPYDTAFVKRMQKAIVDGPYDWRQVCLLNAALGEIFADAVFQALKEAHLQPSDIDLIGSHGQTIWHAPDSATIWGQPARGTLQLGEPSIIAARTNVPVVADFRPADMAVGGQGAPLVAFADEVLFGQDGIASGVLNLGGIANLTVLSAKGTAEMAFDTGPGNLILDGLAERLLKQPFDRDGAVAARGRVDELLLEELMSEPYFRRSPPKTTGRELFGQPFVEKILDMAQKRSLNERDLLATATALTAYSIGQAYDRFVSDKVRVERLILGGGGADNSFLVKQLRFAWPHPVNFIRHETLGVSTKFKESLLFALLAFTTYFGIPNNVPGCTGAKKRLCLGKIVGVNGGFS